MESNVDLLEIDSGAVTAPAGCGKTHLIAQALSSYKHAKPILVLTHTNAGVAALRSRLDCADVPRSAYRLSTIDGWAMRLASAFPKRSAIAEDILKLANPGRDYPRIRGAAVNLLKEGHISDILAASFSRLIVDEYQDCSIRQHAVVSSISEVLPTCVLGDPLQAIFGFGVDRLAQWDTEVCNRFPIMAQLSIPWRWINANAEPLGHWILDVRSRLLKGDQIDLREGPDAVQWIELDGKQDHQQRLAAARVKPPDGEGSVLIIGDSTSPTGQRKMASQTPGAVTVEAVDLRDLITFSRGFDPNSPSAIERLSEFAQSVMTNVGTPNLLKRLESLKNGRARRAPSEVERAALLLFDTPSYEAALDFLVKIGNEGGTRAYRPAVLRACISALSVCVESPSISFHEAAIRMREQYRFAGRPLPRRAVGSTLLLKGLEAEVAVILNAQGLNVSNFYVAMSRGSKLLNVCSQTPIFASQ